MQPHEPAERQRLDVSPRAGRAAVGDLNGRGDLDKGPVRPMALSRDDTVRLQPTVSSPDGYRALDLNVTCTGTLSPADEPEPACPERNTNGVTAMTCKVCKINFITIADRDNVCRECRKATNVHRTFHLNTR